MYTLMSNQLSDSSEEAVAKAFNQGSDARIMGKLLESNPYPHLSPLRAQWNLGWVDVDSYWGYFSCEPVKELPEVEW